MGAAICVHGLCMEPLPKLKYHASLRQSGETDCICNIQYVSMNGFVGVSKVLCDPFLVLCLASDVTSSGYEKI
jgi:hypothetical protein